MPCTLYSIFFFKNLIIITNIDITVVIFFYFFEIYNPIAKIAYKFSIPRLGVNCGKIGFLVDVNKEEIIKKVKDILKGNFFIDRRLLINGVVTNLDSKKISSHALNDIVIHNYGLLKMVEVKIFVNDYLINTERSDGIIIATPTGSTAYSMSNGCPIVSPNSNVISIVPVAPHTFSHRPIIINSSDRIKIIVAKKLMPVALSLNPNDVRDKRK